MTSTTIPVTSCRHTTTAHLFTDPFCEKRSLLEKIATIAFHILTLGIPLVIYHVVTGCMSYFSSQAKSHDTGNLQKNALDSTKPKKLVLDRDAILASTRDLLVNAFEERGIQDISNFDIVLNINGVAGPKISTMCTEDTPEKNIARFFEIYDKYAGKDIDAVTKQISIDEDRRKNTTVLWDFIITNDQGIHTISFNLHRGSNFVLRNGNLFAKPTYHLNSSIVS